MQADSDPMAADPLILPGKAIFHDSKEVFRREFGKDWNSIRNNFRQRDTLSNTPQEKDFIEHIDTSRLDFNKSSKPNLSVKDAVETLSGNFNTQTYRDHDKNKTSCKGKSPAHEDRRLTLLPHPPFSRPHDTFACHVAFVAAASRNCRASGTPSGSPPSSPVHQQQKSPRSAFFRLKVLDFSSWEVFQEANSPRRSRLLSAENITV